MTLKEAFAPQPWMNGDDKDTAKSYARQIRKQFKQAGVRPAPLLHIRVNDVLISLLLTRRAEASLITEPADIAELHKILEAIGKTRDRLRKAMKELETACATAGTPIEMGLADRVKPIMLKAQGLERLVSNPSSSSPEPGAPLSSPQDTVKYPQEDHNMLRKSLVSLLLVYFLLQGCATGIKPARNTRPTEILAETTGYCPCKKCCGWERNWYFKPVVKDTHKRKKVGQTASGAKARPGTIAADWSKYPPGTVIHVPGYGYGRVEDKGSAIQGEKFDLFFKKHRQALQWGRQKIPVQVYLPTAAVAAAQ